MSLSEERETLNKYVSDINRFPVLSKEDESKLAYDFVNNGDMQAYNKLINANLRFVVKIAHEYKAYGLKFLDLIQEGNMGLMVGARKFDPKRGFRLISYCVWWIRAYIQNHVLRSWSLVKLGTTQAQRKLFYKLRATQSALAKMDDQTGSEVDEATAVILGVDLNSVTSMNQRMHTRDCSLNNTLAPAGQGDGHDAVKYIDILRDEGNDQEETLSRLQEQHNVNQAIDHSMQFLNEREKFVIRSRVMAENPITLRELGEQLNISKERARQIEFNALRKIKANYHV